MVEYLKREAIIEELEEEIQAGDVTLDEEVWINKGLNIALQDIKRLPAENVQPIDRWISVDDRLPNIGERVYVYIPRPDNHYNTEIAYISEGNDDFPYWVLRDKSQFYSTRFHYISCWMPLPEPPKGGEEE